MAIARAAFNRGLELRMFFCKGLERGAAEAAQCGIAHRAAQNESCRRRLHRRHRLDAFHDRICAKPAIRLSRKDWPSGANGAVVSPIRAERPALGSCPAGLKAEVGLRWWRRNAARTRSEDPNAKAYSPARH